MWKTLKQVPMSSRWSLRGEKNGWKYWANNSGRLFREREADDGSKVWQKYAASITAKKEGAM